MKKNEFLFMIFGLDSEYCTILDTNFIIKIMRESGGGGCPAPPPSSSEKKSNSLNSYSKITKH